MQIIRIRNHEHSQLQSYKYIYNEIQSDNNKSYSHCKSVVVNHLKQFKTFYT